MSNKKGDATFVILTTLLVIFFVVVMTFLLYYYVTAPFGSIYGFSRFVQFAVATLVSIIMVSILLYVILSEENFQVSDSIFGLGKSIHKYKRNVARDIDVLFDDLDHQIKTKNVGTLDNGYYQIMDLVKDLSPTKRRKVMERAEEIKIRIDEIKQEFG